MESPRKGFLAGDRVRVHYPLSNREIDAVVTKDQNDYFVDVKAFDAKLEGWYEFFALARYVEKL